MSFVAKGVKKAFRSVSKFLKKAWTAVTTSDIGKVALAAAAVYMGGQAMGMWGGGGGAGAGAGVGAGATESALLTGGDALAAGTAGAGAGAGTATAASTASGLAAPVSTGTGLINAGQAAGAFNAAGSAVAGGQAAGALAKGAGIIGSFLKNPVVQQAVVGGIQGAFTPDEIDLMREQERIEKERQRRAFEGVGDISLGVRPAAPLPQRDNTGGLAYNSFAPGAGLIGKNMLPYRPRS